MGVKEGGEREERGEKKEGRVMICKGEKGRKDLR